LNPSSKLPVGNQLSAPEKVFNPLSILDAGTPSVLMLLPIMAIYFKRSVKLPIAQKPEVYEGRKNSSAMWRLSTLVQNGKLPSTLRVPGSDLIPPPIVNFLLNVYCKFPASTVCAPNP